MTEHTTSTQPTEPLWNEADEALFWRDYARHAQPGIERACRALSRAKTDNGMSPEDMLAWADDRTWNLMRRRGWPFFHDEPTPEHAAERLASSARTLARWAYLALSRRHWRRKQQEQRYMSRLGRAERLAAVSSSTPTIEAHEDARKSIEQIRQRVSQKVLARAAASWQDEGERRRVAVALGATRPQDQELIDSVENGEVTRNTIDQMRSRSRKQIRDTIANVARSIAITAAILIGGSMLTPADALAGGEQTGGRGGASINAPDSPACHLIARGGEQTGGRGGKG